MPELNFKLSDEGADKLLEMIFKQAALDYRDGMKMHWPQKIKSLEIQTKVAKDTLIEVSRKREEKLRFLSQMKLGPSSAIYQRTITELNREAEAAELAYIKASKTLKRSQRKSLDFYTSEALLPEKIKVMIRNNKRALSLDKGKADG